MGEKVRVDTCWKKHDLPDHMTKKLGLSVHANAVLNDPLQQSDSVTDNPMQLTSEQFSQIGQFLQYMKQNKESTTDVQVNMAGTTNSSITMIIDSGATNHITCNREWSTALRKTTTLLQFVHLPIGLKCVVTHIGSYSLASGHYLKNVLLDPEFKLFDLCFKITCSIELQSDLFF